MSLWSRIANVFRSDRLSREIEEELESHIREAIEHGCDPVEARSAFGSMWKRCEESREIRVVRWLDSFYRWIDSLRADSIFSWRQLAKNKVTSAAAILSLALALGACTSAFRLIDALLLRPLPISNPYRLYLVLRHFPASDGSWRTGDRYDYPLFQKMRAATRNDAELISISGNNRVDLTYGSDQEMEKAHQQYVSGWMFSSFGLRPALGRLFTEADDLKPGGHPYAVLSNDYWRHRFGRDPNVIGRTFRMGNDLFTIIGVVNGPFNGTEPGVMTDIFIPSMMFEGVKHPNWGWTRIFVRPKPGVQAQTVLDQLRSVFASDNAENVKRATGVPRVFLDRELRQTIDLESAASGISGIQSDNRAGLLALAALVALVLLIACANLSNLMTAHGFARARELAVRVAMGAKRWRLVQLVLVESAWIAFLASLIGAFFASWSAPFVVSKINPPNNPVRLVLSADWRVLGLGIALIAVVTVIFGLIPGLRASDINPVSALKGGEDPHSRNRLMHAAIAAQVAFCFLVVFVAGLFINTLHRLADRPTGFSAERVLTLDTVAPSPQPQLWEQVADHLRSVPGVERVAIATMPLLINQAWNDLISINGGTNTEPANFLSVSPGWFDTMKVRLISGRDFSLEDTYPNVAIVNETFVRHYLNGEEPLGKFFETHGSSRVQIVGLVADARYHDIRELDAAIVYVPFRAVERGKLQPIGSATLIARTSADNPLGLASILRQEVPRARSEFRVSNIRSQMEINLAQTVRERLLATLAGFFAAVALLLAAIGLYGVLNYSVIQRRREIGIRMAVGAGNLDIAREVTSAIFSMLAAGAIAGWLSGIGSVRFIQALLYQTKATDTRMLVIPGLTLFVAAIIATLPPVIRALRIDPVWCLRAE